MTKEAKDKVDSLPNTGERMIPEFADRDTFWEHVYRYRFACQFVQDRRVLDAACGEGYGTAALVRAHARSVIGIDVSAEACEHARRKYGVDARTGNAQSLPLATSSVDVVVSFETIEHLPSPGAFLSECRRVLTRNGLLIISTPNRLVYSGNNRRNAFHCSELAEDEFVDLLRKQFRKVKIYGQSLVEIAGFWSLRSLAALHSPWFDAKGYWRAQQAFAGHLLSSVVDDKYRDAAATILRRDNILTHLFNPFAVRRRLRLSGEMPRYWVGVARV